MTSHGEKVRESPHGASARETPMRAIVQEAYGYADVLHLAHIARPAIGEKEVLVRVHAAGLDRGTWHVSTGLPYALRMVYGIRAPKNPVPGLDLGDRRGDHQSPESLSSHSKGWGTRSVAWNCSARAHPKLTSGV